MIYAYIIITCVWTFHFDSYFYYCYFSTIITSAWCSRKIWLMLFSHIQCLLGSVWRVEKKNKVLIKITADTLFFAIVFADLVDVFHFNCIISNQRHSSSWNLHLIFFVCAERDISPCCFESVHSMFSWQKKFFLKSSKWGLGLFNSQAVLNV